LRQVVPWRLSSLPAQAATPGGQALRGMPCFLKSWNTYSKALLGSQARAFLTVSQLGMPYRVIWGCFMGEIMPICCLGDNRRLYAHQTPHIGRLAPHCERLHPQNIDMGLERVREVAHRMALRFDCPVITVAGTNGKGSTCAMLEAVACRPVTAPACTPRRIWCISKSAAACMANRRS
jgi:hypothetical protein